MDLIKVTCPNCRGLLGIPPSSMSKQTKCPKCGDPFVPNSRLSSTRTGAHRNSSQVDNELAGRSEVNTHTPEQSRRSEQLLEQLVDLNSQLLHKMSDLIMEVKDLKDELVDEVKELQDLLDFTNENSAVAMVLEELDFTKESSAVAMILNQLSFTNKTGAVGMILEELSFTNETGAVGMVLDAMDELKAAVESVKSAVLDQ